jgi:hypothetical protein
VTPLSSAFAHAHLAAVGWAVMMVVGLSYRLIPMILPAAMPTGTSLVASAVLLQVGVVVLVVSLIGQSRWTPAGALIILAGLASFVGRVKEIVAHRRPPPAALPRPDWATRQTHTAFIWLLVAAAVGLALTLPLPLAWTVTLGWTYGAAGLVGFLAQIVVGIQGRLLPLHAWYRAFEAGDRRPQARSAHELGSRTLSKWILLVRTAGVPVFTAALAAGSAPAISAGSALLLAGVALNAVRAYTIAAAVE